MDREHLAEPSGGLGIPQESFLLHAARRVQHACRGARAGTRYRDVPVQGRDQPIPDDRGPGRSIPRKRGALRQAPSGHGGRPLPGTVQWDGAADETDRPRRRLSGHPDGAGGAIWPESGEARHPVCHGDAPVLEVERPDEIRNRLRFGDREVGKRT